MSRYGLLWFIRLAGIALLSLVYLGLLMSVTVTDLGGLLSRGPGGVELGGVYRQSEAGRRNSFVGEALSWPIIKPVAMIESRLGGSTIRSTRWRAFAAAAFYANSLVWGIGLWLALEGLMRGTYRGLRYVFRSRSTDLPAPAPEDAKPSR